MNTRIVDDHIAFLNEKIQYWSTNKDDGEYAVGCSNAYSCALLHLEKLVNDIIYK